MKPLSRFALLLCLLVSHTTLMSQIHHVEPLNWWVGMRNPQLQLMIHGEKIGETTPTLSYPGVTLKKVTRGDSRNYLFLDLVIDKNTRPGRLTLRFKKEGKLIYQYEYELKSREQDGNAFKGFDASDVIYLIVPDRFANGDPGNDVVPGMRESKVDRNFAGGRHGGDLRGIIQHLDYIRDMGYTAIWPTPVLENDMPGYSYHGYSITHHYKVDPRYGSLEDYKELSRKIKEKGMKLIFDEVLNHTGSHYWWAQDLPFKNWLNYPDKYVQTNHRRTVNQDLYASQYDIDLWKNGWFDKTMPDMNGKNPFMARYLIQNTIWWIETLQLGGIRQDTYGYSDKEFLKTWSCAVMTEYPRFNIVGEEWSTNPLITSYWQQGKKNHDGYTGCLKTVMDFPIQEALVKSLTGNEEASYLPAFSRLYEALANDFVYPDPNNILVFGDNHDMNRLYMQLKQDADLTKMALTYLLTIRGIPQVFYGTELLLDNTPHHKNDGLIRADFPGGWNGDSVNGFTGQGLSARQLEVQTYVKQLLNWRKKNPVIAKGKTLHFAPFDGLYVYFRYQANKMVMVVMNLNATEKTLDPVRFSEVLGNRSRALDVISNQWLALQPGLPIRAKSAMVFEIQ